MRHLYHWCQNRINYQIKFLNGDISGDRFYNDVDNALGLFEREHPGVDYLKDPALNVYFS
jgi:hypothetical protein